MTKFSAAICLVLTACLVLASLAPVIAQQGITRMPLTTVDFPPGYQTVTQFSQMAAGICAERHSHPGIETGYVLEGDLLLKIEGRPDQLFKAGDHIPVPLGVPHLPCTTGGTKIFTVHIVEKGKPFASPAP
jgi:quercetin dioxygenase-like cupin family protein